MLVAGGVYIENTPKQPGMKYWSEMYAAKSTAPNVTTIAVPQSNASLPFSQRREALVREARRLRTASQIDQWLSSSELQPPK